MVGKQAPKFHFRVCFLGICLEPAAIASIPLETDSQVIYLIVFLEKELWGMEERRIGTLNMSHIEARGSHFCVLESCNAASDYSEDQLSVKAINTGVLVVTLAI